LSTKERTWLGLLDIEPETGRGFERLDGFESDRVKPIGPITTRGEAPEPIVVISGNILDF
jgi:hypothetical protein